MFVWKRNEGNLFFSVVQADLGNAAWDFPAGGIRNQDAGILFFRESENHRRKATTDQIASTTPKGHAPWRKPYTEASAQDNAKPRMNQRLRRSNA